MNRDLTVVVSVLGSLLAATIGPWVLRKLNQAFSQDVDVIPPYPIILKPYRSLVCLYVGVGMICIALFAILLMAYMAKHLSWVLPAMGSVILIIPLISFVRCFHYCRESITVETDRLTYRTNGTDVVVEFSDIKSFRIITGYLIFETSDQAPKKISLYFENIKYLNAALKRWFSSDMLAEKRGAR